MARAKAEEDWAVQEQMRHLKAALAGQLDELGEARAARGWH